MTPEMAARIATLTGVSSMPRPGPPCEHPLENAQSSLAEKEKPSRIPRHTLPMLMKHIGAFDER
jgi:hypothetical protein